MANYPLLMRIVSNSLSVCNFAGGIIRDVLAMGELGIIDKGIDDPQTEADRRSERCILASLSKNFPGVKILSEESGSQGIAEDQINPDWIVTEMDQKFLKEQKCPDSLLDIDPKDLVIWVDPLDGTTEFTQGFLERVTVLIGIAFRNTAVAGVIHQPYFQSSDGEYGRSIWGIKDIAGGNQSIFGGNNFTLKNPPENKFVVTTTRSHSNQLLTDSIQAFKPDEVIRVGGAGFKSIQLLEGNAHCYLFPSPGCKKWDTAGPEACLEAAGGVLTDILGKHYSYGGNAEFPNSSGVLATSPFYKNKHAELIEKIPEHVKNAMKKC